jgi:hypothetical protein
LTETGRRGRGKRLLYWFRTPPGVRVGRAPIDETAIRLLEQHNPDVQFDWTRILKAPPAAEGQGRRDRGDRDQRGRREARPPQRSRGGPPSSLPVPPAPVDASAPALVAPVVPERPEVEQENTSSGVPEFLAPHEATALGAEAISALGAEAAEAAKAAAKAAVDEEISSSDTPDLLSSCEEGVKSAEVAPASGPEEATEPAPIFEARPEDAGSASYQRLGAEGLVRIRARYAEVMARIAERPMEEEAREELKQRAERLNPDAWVTADEVTAALEQYETVFEGLRGVVGRHPRGRRRGRR